MIVSFSAIRIVGKGLDPSFMPINSPPTNLPLFLATVVYSFEGCGALLPIENALETPSNFRKICVAGFCTFFVCYTAIGLLGYAAFPFGKQIIILSFVFCFLSFPFVCMY